MNSLALHWLALALLLLSCFLLLALSLSSCSLSTGLLSHCSHAFTLHWLALALMLSFHSPLACSCSQSHACSLSHLLAGPLPRTFPLRPLSLRREACLTCLLLLLVRWCRRARRRVGGPSVPPPPPLLRTPSFSRPCSLPALCLCLLSCRTISPSPCRLTLLVVSTFSLSPFSLSLLPPFQAVHRLCRLTFVALSPHLPFLCPCPLPL